jgi:hypothetical protein
MAASQTRGKIFEALIKYYLSQHGYTIIPENIRNYYGIKKRSNGLNVKGRGAYHQIDALGQFQFIIPFVYPIRLIAEAKCYNSTRIKSMGINKIRDFVGVVKDISENYVIDTYRDLKYKSRFRFTDSGVFFSTLPFSKNAEMYAYAQGIYLIPCPQVLPFVNCLYSQMNRNNEFKQKVENFIVELNQGRFSNINDLELESDIDIYSYFGMVMSWLPILISSKKQMPLEAFRDTDNIDVEIGYNYIENEERRTIPSFQIRFNNWQGNFQIPFYMFAEYVKSINFFEDMANMKEKNLNYIDIPFRIGEIRRIIRLNIDIDWLNNYRRSLEDRRRHNG